MTITASIYGNPSACTLRLNELRSKSGILSSNLNGIELQVAAISMERGTALKTDFSWFNILHLSMCYKQREHIK